MNTIFKKATLSTTWLWFILLAIAPIGLMIYVGLSTYNEQQLFSLPFTLQNFRESLNALYFKIMLRSLYFASIATLTCLILGYPFAYFLSKTHSRYKNVLLILTLIPFWISSLVRTYAIMLVLKTKGLLNAWLLSWHIIKHPIPLLYSDTATLIGFVYALLPFMILPIYASLERLDKNLFEAAQDLGANKLTIFTKIILPQTRQGIITGIFLVFLPAMTLFYIPTLLGGAKNMLFGNLIENQFLEIPNWPLGASTSVLFIGIMAIILLMCWPYLRPSQSRKQS